MSENPYIYPYRRKKNDTCEELLAEQTGAFSRFRFILYKLTGSSFGIREFFLLVVAFSLGRAEILGGIYPFAVAFLGATAVSTERNNLLLLPMVFLGTISAMGVQAVNYIIIDLIIFILFYFNHLDKKKRWIVLPASIFAVNISVGTLFALIDGITGYSLMVLFFEGILAAALSMVFIVFYNTLDTIEEGQSVTGDELVCSFVLLLGALAGFGDLSIGGIAIADVLSRFLIMLAALWGSAGAAAGVGALMGILPSLSSMASPVTVGVYAFSGLLAGAFNSFGKAGVTIGFFLGNILMSTYLIAESDIATQLITALVAILLILLLPGSWVRFGQRIFGKITLRSEIDTKSSKLLQTSGIRLRATSQIFRELANSCEAMAQKEMRSDEENIQMVLNHLSGKVCSDCSVNNLCWKIDFQDTYRGVMELFNCAEKSGKASVRDVPENFQKRCSHLKELVATVNCLYELYCRSNYWQKQKISSRQVIAGQLMGTAQVLDGLAREVTRGSKERDILERDVTNLLARSGMPSDSTSVVKVGDKNIDVYADFRTCPGEVNCRDKMEEVLSSALQKKFHVHQVNCSATCGQRCRFQLFEAGAKKLVLGRSQLSKAGNGLCGDSDASVLLADGKEILMLSDGMGVGRDAAVQSGTAINILRRLLEAGFEKDTAIDTVNTILMLQGGDESFVTLDMCIIDLYSSTAEFVKTGGIPSFIKRENGVELIESASLPVGMLASVEKQVTSVRLFMGDTVILASDGLLEGNSALDLAWLKCTIEQAEQDDPQALADYLLNKAIAISGGRLKDDITILVAQMKAA